MSIFGIPIGNEDNTFYSLLNFEHIHKKDSSLLGKIEKFDSRLFNIIKKSTLYSNPVIAAYQFNF